MGTLEIRRYRPSDRDAVWELHNVALEAVGAHAGHGPFDEDLHTIETVYLNGGGEFLVGMLDDRLVAMGALRRHTQDLAEITRMRVHPDCWRLGFGRAVLTRLEQRARELGFTRLFLETTTGQAAAQKLYETGGYRRTGRRRSYAFEVIRFEKDLDTGGEN